MQLALCCLLSFYASFKAELLGHQVKTHYALQKTLYTKIKLYYEKQRGLSGQLRGVD